MEIKQLNKENTVVEATEGGFVSLTIQGETYENVTLIRTFPFTAVNEYISVRQSDENATEIGMIENLETDFDKEAREQLQKQLSIRYFTPKIKKILSIKDEGGCSYFEVDTDAGRSHFVVRSNDNRFMKLTDTRIMIEDLENNRFEIPDITKLSVKERRKLDIFL